MRVTLVTETYFPQVNGVSRTLRELARCLRESGDDVLLICPDYGTSIEEQNFYAVPSIVLPFYKELRLPRPPFGRVHRALTAFRPDIIHIATEATLGWSLLRYALSRGLPVVSSFHTNFDQYSSHYGVGWAKGLIWRYLRWFHNRTRETYVPSNTTIRQLETMGFERLALWRRGVDSEVFRPDRPRRDEVRRALGWLKDDVVIAYVSRIAPEKNVDYLAQALTIVAADRPEVRILFVGDGPSRGALQQRIGAIAHFAGYRQGADLADHYAAADLFAFSSLTETLGNVVLEAMASGLPVVALRAGGVGETIEPGSNGILVEPDEPPERFAAALRWLIDRADERARMAEAARTYAITQSWEAIMAGLRVRYQAAIGKRVDLCRQKIESY
jgi:glycosyltransferase involved in cell wall biosynthesis